jgi:hypothetical protein
MTHYEIVSKLIGHVRPVGETDTDITRFSNLKDMINLTELLLEEINTVASFSYRKEYSIKRAAEYADNFLTSISTKY